MKETVSDAFSVGQLRQAVIEPEEIADVGRVHGLAQAKGEIVIVGDSSSPVA